VACAPARQPPPDFNRNWIVDAADATILAQNWLGPIVIREFSLDGSPGWKMEGQWQFGPPQGRGGASYGRPDPNAGSTGANVFGVNLAEDARDRRGKALSADSYRFSTGNHQPGTNN
jgi:hypothetical protein